MKTILIIALALTASAAFADEFNIVAATGIARIISQSERCGIAVQQEGMDAYLAKAGLSSADALGHIANMVDLTNTLGDPANDAECTVIRSTANAIGVAK